MSKNKDSDKIPCDDCICLPLCIAVYNNKERRSGFLNTIGSNCKPILDYYSCLPEETQFQQNYKVKRVIAVFDYFKNHEYNKEK